MDEYLHGCTRCVQINKIELYGETTHSEFYSIEDETDETDNKESISIIGKLRKY